MEDLRKYLTVRQTAEKLDISEESVRELIKNKHLRAVKIGKWRIKPQDLEDFIKSKSNME
jgi:excisionase family DNA binding protein